MRIGIAARGLSERAGGAKEYIRSLTTALLTAGSDHQVVIFYDRAELRGTFPMAKEVVVTAQHKLLWDYVRLPAAIRQQRLDACLFPKNVVPPNINCRTIVIIHDLLHLKDPAVYRWVDSAYMRWAIPRSLKRADAVVAVSENTRRDLLQLTAVDPAKVHVVYEAADPKFRPVTLSPMERQRLMDTYGLRPPFILVMGSLSPRKNIPRIVAAFTRAKQVAHLPHRLVLAGGKRWKSQAIERAIADSAVRRDIIITGMIADNDVPLLYTMAALSVYASLYEGFGLPVLESMACGCPVICSTASSLPEVAGHAAYLVDPTDIPAMTQQRRAAMITAGFQQHQRFSWPGTAAKILTLIESLT